MERRAWQSLIDLDAASDLLAELVAIPSPNPGASPVTPGTGEAAMAAYVADFFRQYPVAVERIEIAPGRWNVLVRWIKKSSADEILWEAHLDTVPPGSIGQPYSPHLEHGKLYGLGACDTKASLAAMMLALRALVEADVPFATTVALLGAADEEYRARGIQAYVATGTRPTLAILGEPTQLQIASAQRGNMLFHITTRGRAAHASCPDNGTNAIYLMAEIVQRLRELAENYSTRSHPLCGSPTLNVGEIQGGQAAWIVPEECTIAVDRRWIPGENWFAVWSEIRDAVSFAGDAVEIEEPTWRVGEMETSADELVVRALQSACNQLLGYSKLVGAPFTSEAPYLVEVGVPSVIFGPGSIEQAHSRDEFVQVEQVVHAAHILAESAIQMDAELGAKRPTEPGRA